MEKKNCILSETRSWIYRNAREIELSLWRYFFEHGKKEDVLSALSAYQNEDGGFGHALEPDSWNPNSSPYTTLYAINILKSIEFTDLDHPLYVDIMKYLHSEKDLMEYGWRFSIPSNDDYPHAPWWNYNEESNVKESIGISAKLASFLLQYEDKNSDFYQKIIKITKHLVDKMLHDEEFGDMGIGGFIVLVDTINKIGLKEFDYDSIQNRLNQLVKKSIEHDISKWAYYGVRPSNYISSPNSIYYADNKDIVQKELQYLIETKPDNDVWGITWTWFENMDKYQREFAISENWWKSYKAIEKIRFLNNFSMLPPFLASLNHKK